jgi:hypothetical protein
MTMKTEENCIGGSINDSSVIFFMQAIKSKQACLNLKRLISQNPDTIFSAVSFARFKLIIFITLIKEGIINNSEN